LNKDNGLREVEIEGAPPGRDIKMDEEVLETIGREYIKRVMTTIFARIKETEG